MIHVHYLRVKLAKDWYNDGDKVEESWSNNGECDRNVRNEINKELKFTETRVIYGRYIEEYVDRKKQRKDDRLAEEKAAYWWDEEQLN